MTVIAERQMGSIFSLGIDYRDTPHAVLTTVADARSVAEFFVEEGFECWSPNKPELAAARPSDILDEIDAWADTLRGQRRPCPVAVVYSGGHGRNDGGGHYTLAATSPARAPYNATKAISASALVEIVRGTGAQYTVVIFDSCFAGGAAADLLEAAAELLRNRGPGGTALVGIAAAWTNERAASGVLVANMLEVLRNFNSGTERLTAFELVRELHSKVPDQTIQCVGSDGAPVFPNANYLPDGPDRTPEFSMLLSDLPADDRDHFLLKAAGSDALDIGWFFEGRAEPSRAIVEWLAANSQGILAVTGPPGAGKSALLGRFAVLADEASQRACRRLGMLDGDGTLRPPVGVFDAVIHLKNRSYRRAATELAEQLGIDVGASTDPTNALLNALVDTGRAVCVLADALDEADTAANADLIGRALLRRLAALPGCRVVVGTRRDREGIITAADDDPGPLLRALGSPDVVDLAADENVTNDIATYVDRSLERTGRWPTASRRRAAGLTVASVADGVFLFARFAIKALSADPETIIDDPAWRARLPSDAGGAGLFEVFAADLARFEQPALVREALRPLAFAFGKSLPRRYVWPMLATALSGEQRTFTDADIGAVIRSAGSYLIESTEDGQTVYRLYHQAIADYLRDEARHAL